MKAAVYNRRLRRIPGCHSPRVLFSICCFPFFAVTVFLVFRMHVKGYLTAAVSVLPALVNGVSGAPSNDPFQVYTISAQNITAKYIPYGARLTSVLVHDRLGRVQDVVLGYDDPKRYVTDTETDHTYFGAVVGRYANRIKNGTFSIDGKKYHLPTNENDGADTIHGGPVGYDQRNWTVTAHTKSSVTFTLLDRGLEGFPGDVITHATYSVDSDVTSENPHGLPQLTTKLVSLSLTGKTPIMLANHIYWNLNAFKEPNVLHDTYLQLPLSPRLIAGDPLLVPNGTISEVSEVYDGGADFVSGKLVGQDVNKTFGLCGSGCTGYDTCFIIDRPPWYPSTPSSLVPALRLNSSTTGIALEVSTNQRAFQIFGCASQSGTIPIKESQAKRNEAEGKGGTNFVNKYGCVVIETEGWIDGINNPQWGQKEYQIYSPEDGPAVNWAKYKFSTY